MKLKISLIVAFLFFCKIASLSAQDITDEESIDPNADTTPVIYYIFDASRSMWGRGPDGKPKIETAKNQMSKIISELPDSVYTGVAAFGTRKMNDCDDIEELSAIGKINKEDVAGKIRSINPIGKTPLASSIQFAYDRIKQYKGPKTIVLLTDGVEACDLDPCAVTKKLKEGTSNFSIEVIGFGTTDEESKQLNCIAEASKGTFHEAKESAELLAFLKEAEKKALEKPKFKLSEENVAGNTVAHKVPAPNNPEAIVRVGNGELEIQHEPWLIRPNYWRLLDSETGEEVVRFSSFEARKLPPGTFTLAWRQYQHGSTEVILDKSVKIVDNQRTILTLLTAIRLNVPSWTKPPRFWGLTDIETKEQIATFSIFNPFLVAAGSYELIWKQNESKEDIINFGKIEIEEGKVNEINLTSSILLKPAAWLSNKIYYWGIKDPGSPEWVARFYGNLDQQIVPPGKFNIYYRQFESDSTDSELGTVEVENNQELLVPLTTGIRLVTKVSSFTPEIVEFAELDESRKITRTVKTTKNLSAMPLKPGKYRVSYVPAGKDKYEPIVAAEELDLKAGQLAEINLDDLLHSVNIITLEVPL